MTCNAFRTVKDFAHAALCTHALMHFMMHSWNIIQLAGGTPLLQASAPGLHSLMSAAVFPIGLTMIVFTKTDLLTSNFYYQVYYQMWFQTLYENEQVPVS